MSTDCVLINMIVSILTLLQLGRVTFTTAYPSSDATAPPPKAFMSTAGPLPPAQQLNGRSMDAHVQTKLRSGDISKWDSTALGTVLRGLVTSPYNLNHRLSAAQYTAKVTAGTALTPLDETMRQCDALCMAIDCRNSMAHQTNTQSIAVNDLKTMLQRARDLIDTVFDGDQANDWQKVHSPS